MNAKLNHTDKTAVAEAIVHALCVNNVEPRDEASDSRGDAWGHVAVWSIDDRDELYVVKYGDNGSTYYDITADSTDLCAWLMPDDGDQVARANAYSEDPDVAGEEHAGPCRVIVAEDFYNAVRKYDWIMDSAVTDTGAEGIHEFENQEEAQAWIDECERQPYYLAHNEVGRPDYFIIAA